MSEQEPTAWPYRSWFIGAGFTAGGSLYLASILAAVRPTAVLLLLLHPPAYMMHGVGDHRGDRGRLFLDDRPFGGHDALRPVHGRLANMLLVWGLNLGALYAGAA